MSKKSPSSYTDSRALAARYGRSVDPIMRERAILQLCNDLVSQHLVSNGDEEASRNYVNQTLIVPQAGAGIWHIANALLPELDRLVEHEKQWVTLNSQSIKPWGISLHPDSIDSYIESWHQATCGLLCHTKDYSPESAEARWNRMVRRAANYQGNESWQIRKEYCDDFVSHVKYERDYVSSNNAPRLKELDIHHHPNVIDKRMARLYQQRVSQRLNEDKNEEAAIFLTGREVRHGLTRTGNPIWQMHSSARELWHGMKSEEPWFNSHNTVVTSRYFEITTQIPIVDAALKELYQELVQAEQKENPVLTPQQTYAHTHILRPATTRKGSTSWEFTLDGVDTIRLHKPEIFLRRSGAWIGPGNKGWNTENFHASEEEIQKAIEVFRQRQSEELRTAGFSDHDASSYIARKVVCLLPITGGKLVPKIRENDRDEIREIVKEFRQNKKQATTVVDASSCQHNANNLAPRPHQLPIQL